MSNGYPPFFRGKTWPSQSSDNTNNYPGFDKNGHPFFHEEPSMPSELSQLLPGGDSKEIWEKLFEIGFAFANLNDVFSNLSSLYKLDPKTNEFIRIDPPKTLDPAHLNKLVKDPGFQQAVGDRLNKLDKNKTTINGNKCVWSKTFKDFTECAGKKIFDFDSNDVNPDICKKDEPEGMNISIETKFHAYLLGLLANYIGLTIGATHTTSKQTFNIAKHILKGIDKLHAFLPSDGKKPAISELIKYIVNSKSFPAWQRSVVEEAYLQPSDKLPLVQSKFQMQDLTI